jgi:hypothetical protein
LKSGVTLFPLTFHLICIIKGYERVKKEAKMDIIERFFQHAEQSFFLWIISKKIGVKAAALRELRKNCK